MSSETQEAHDQSSTPPLASQTSSLVDDLPYLERLEELRTRAASTLKGAARALVERPKSIWGEDISQTSVLYLRRAKHLAWTLGVLASTEESRFPDLIETSSTLPTDEPALLLSNNCNLFTSDQDEASTLYASSYIRARLDEASEAISQNLFLCFYKIVREIHSVDSPDWALGGVKAGGAANEASVFLTSECARALGYLANKLSRTANFLRDLAEYEAYAAEIGVSKNHPTRPLPEIWCSTELERVKLGLLSLLDRDKDSMLLRIPRNIDTAPEEIILQIRSILHQFIAKTFTSIDVAKSAISSFRSAEEEFTKKRIDQEPDRVREFARPLALSQTAHHHANRSIETMTGLIDELQTKIQNNTNFPFLSVARLFDRAAKGVQRNLEPISVFMKNKLHTSLFSSTGEGVFANIPDIAFSALSSGAMNKDWSSPIYVQALTTLTRAMSEEGRFPKGRPFHIGRDGLERYAANAHLARAYCYIAQHVPGQIDPISIERLLYYFDHTSMSITLEDGSTGFGWSRSENRKSRKASSWLSTVSCLALFRIERLLRTKINEQALRHFSVKSKTSLRDSLSINDLMCTDLGLASLQWKGRKRHMVTSDLEAIRTHFFSPTSESPISDRRRKLSSVILYGPPGTGKTTLVESLAGSTGVDLVQVTPSDFLFLGSEGLERQSRAVMRALCLLSNVMILFDEFDTILFSRDTVESGPVSTFEFLTGCMLPKLADLNRAVKSRGSAYALATNFIERLDTAAIRPGRFDHKVCVLPPDAPSRVCRLVAQINRWERKDQEADGSDSSISGQELQEFNRRILTLVHKTSRAPVSVLCKPGWYTHPHSKESPKRAWNYLLSGSSEPEWPMPQNINVPEEESATNEYIALFSGEMEAHRAFEHQLAADLQSASTQEWSSVLSSLKNSSRVTEATQRCYETFLNIRMERLK